MCVCVRERERESQNVTTVKEMKRLVEKESERECARVKVRE